MLGICKTADIVISAVSKHGHQTNIIPSKRKKKNQKAISLIVQNNSRKATPPFTIKFNKTSRKLRLIEPLAAQHPDFFPSSVMEMGNFSIINLKFCFVCVIACYKTMGTVTKKKINKKAGAKTREQMFLNLKRREPPLTSTVGSFSSTVPR